MAVVRTIDRVLREPEDASGQSVRSWRIQCEGDFIAIGRSEHSDWLSLTRADLAQFVADLYEAAGAGAVQQVVVPWAVMPLSAPNEAFWKWFPTAYNYSPDSNDDRFSRYNMEVAFRAGAEWKAGT